MDIHSDDECQKYWRDRFSEQIQDCIDSPWGNEYNDSSEAKWFRQGMRYAMMIIRWDYDSESDHKDPI